MATCTRIFIILCPLLLFISSIQPARAAVVEGWVHRYNNVVSNSSDGAFKVVIDQAGDIIVAGYGDDGISEPYLLTMKYSGTDGSLIWHRRYRSPGRTMDPGGIAVDSRGNVVIAAYSPSAENTNLISYTAKYAAADGALLWERIGPVGGGWNQPIAVDSNDNVLIAGWAAGLAKYAASDGRLLWEKPYDGTPKAISIDGGGNAIVIGPSGTDTNPDFYTAKYTTDGSLLWEQRYNGPGNATDSPYAVAVDAIGNVVVTGSSGGIQGNADYYTAKYAAADGALLWERRYNGPANGHDSSFTVAMDSAGNAVVAGVSQGQPYIVKYAAEDGALLWDRRHQNTRQNTQSPYSGEIWAADANGNMIVTGSSWNGTNFSCYVIKYAGADGQLSWEKFGASADPRAMAIHGTTIAIVGLSWSSTTYGPYPDAYTAKYSGADGTLVWEQRYNSLANNVDEAAAVAVDPDGNVAVIGQSTGIEGDMDYYTAKYAGTSGTLLWEKRYNGPGNSTDRAQALAVDQSSNVILMGESWSGSKSESYMAKYAAASGALLWERRGEGGSALAVDSSGNVVVTGGYTAKYAAANGTVLWERRGGGSRVAADGSGNVVVAASSSDAYYVAKYAAADGALLWEKLSPAGRSDSGRGVALALDGNGNILVMGSADGDHYTIKLAANDGRLLWDKRHDESAAFWFRSVAVDGGNNVVILGGSYIAKYAAADGTLVWEKRVSGASAIAVDATGNVVTTGGIPDNNGPYSNDYYTAKYAAADGALLWEKRYNGPANRSDSAVSLAVARNGMVVVTGYGDYSQSFQLRSVPQAVTKADYVTIAYWEDLSPLSIERAATGLRLRLNGIPDRTYQIERANSVAGPWSTVATVTAPSQGLIEYIDSNQPATSVFYRARTQ